MNLLAGLLEKIRAILDRKPIFSRTYTTTANITAATQGTERFLSEDDINTFAPFDTIVVVNDDTVSLGICLDGNPNNYIPVSAGGATSSDSQNFREIRVKNLDAANDHTAGTVHILIQKTKPGGNPYN